MVESTTLYQNTEGNVPFLNPDVLRENSITNALPTAKICINKDNTTRKVHSQFEKSMNRTKKQRNSTFMKIFLCVIKKAVA
jgi:hypothetical protein